MKDLERATGVGREAIRFYIREGLLPEPDRPARNVAWYDESFVDRILLIKRLQEERFLPLTVIRGIVAPDEPLSASEARTLRALGGALGPREETESSTRTIDDVAERSGIPAKEIRSMARRDAVALHGRSGAEHLDAADAEIIELWGRMRRAGFTDELGFTPEMVSLYVEVVEWLTREEVKLFSRLLADKVDDASVRSMAEVGVEVGNRVLGLMREARILRRIADAGRNR